MDYQSVIVRDEDILGGVPVFRGTRVPVQTLLDYSPQVTPYKSFLMIFPQ
jgi:uncharacterized protein (DUF433 family)